jgi:hypothetical protein
MARLPEFYMSVWRGLWAPQDTPAGVIGSLIPPSRMPLPIRLSAIGLPRWARRGRNQAERASRKVVAVLAKEQFRRALSDQGLNPLKPRSLLQSRLR